MQQALVVPFLGFVVSLMPCYCPLDAWPPPPGVADRRFVFGSQHSYAGAVPVRLPCGQCVGCRRDRSQEWAIRILHEAALHDCSVFVSPTFDDEHLPADGSVSVRTLQLFVKRVRHRFGSVRFFGVGEYGERSLRPHYHVIFFGLELLDRYLWKRSPRGDMLYRSAALESCWPFGHVLVGDVTFGAAAYVAQYCLKKVNGASVEGRYKRSSVDVATGEVRSWTVAPEFANMSRRPGLGAEWLSEFGCDCFPSDFLIVDGHKVPVPRYYRKILQERELLALRAKRKLKSFRHVDENTDRRLLVRGEVHRLRAAALSRPMSSDD